MVIPTNRQENWDETRINGTNYHWRPDGFLGWKGWVHKAFTRKSVKWLLRRLQLEPEEVEIIGIETNVSFPKDHRGKKAKCCDMEYFIKRKDGGQ